MHYSQHTETWMSACLHLKVSLRNLPVTRMICSKSFKNSLPGKKKRQQQGTHPWHWDSKWGWCFQRCSLFKGVKQRSQGWRVSPSVSLLQPWAFQSQGSDSLSTGATGLAYFKGELINGSFSRFLKSTWWCAQRRIITGASQAAAGSEEFKHPGALW